MEVKTINDLQKVNGYKPLPKQREFHKRKERYLLLSGSYGGAKTATLCNHILFHMWKFPGARVLLCRQFLASLKRSTMEELFKWCPRNQIENFNKQDGKLTLKNGSVCFFSGLGDERALDKLLSTEFSMIGIDELSETDEKSWQLLSSRLRLTTVPENALQMVASTNPTGGWIKKKFIDFVDSDYYTVCMNASMNPHLPSNYIEQLKKSLPKSQHSSLIDGEWTEVLEINALFDMSKVEEAMQRRGLRGSEEIFAIDVGEYGSDDSVISKRSGNKIQILKRVGKKSIPELGKIIKKVIKDKEAQIVIDALGLGNGLCVLLEEWNYTNIIQFKGAEKSYLPEQYANLKTEMFFTLMDKLDEVALPKSSRLRDEMEQTKYYVNSRGVIQVEGNKTRRKKGLTSPNELDSISMLFSADINEETEGLLQRMIDNLMVVTKKRGETRPGQKEEVKQVASIGKIKGGAGKLPKEFTQKEMVNKSEEEIFDNFAQSKGYGKYIPVGKKH